MATYSADILLNVKSSKAESAVKKIEQGQKNIATASNKILRQDIRIVAERRKLLGLDGNSASLQRQKIRYLSQQKAELVLQKRQLSEIVALEKQSNKSRRSRGSGLGGALAGAGIGAGLTKSFFDASELENADARVKLLGQTYNQLVGIQEAATRSSEKFIISNVDAIKAYVDLGNRLGSQGATIADIENIYEGLNTVLVTNKATAQEAASATLQLNQALGAGKLAGEEYRAINEATPQVITEVAKVLGVARGEVKKLASEGAVNSQVLLQALTNLRKEGADGLKEGLSGAFAAQREFTKALKEFSQVVGTELLPVITPLLKKLSELLKLFGQLPGPIKQVAIGIAAVGAVAGPAAIAIGGLGKALAFISGAGLLAAAPWLALAAGVGAVVVALGSYQSKSTQIANAAKTGGAKEVVAARQELSKLSADTSLLKLDLEEASSGRERQRLKAEISKKQKQINDLKAAIAANPADIVTKPANVESGLAFQTGDVVGGAPRAPKLPTSKASQLQQQISQELLKQFDIKTKFMQLNMSESEALDFQNTRLRERLQREESLLESQRQQALATSKYAADADLINKLFDTRLVTLRGQTEEQIQQNLVSAKQLKIQKEITALRQAEETKNIERDLTRNIEDVERKIASPFGGDEAEQIDLLVKQQRRYIDITDQLKTAIAEQKKLELIDTSGAATNRREALEEQLSIYEKLLPQLNAVEQAELRRNQLMEKYGFIADEAATAMSSAVQSIITGTGSVEEAFSNMFANIGKAFIDMATQMLAQKAILSLLEALGGGIGGGGGGGGGAFNIGKALTGRATGGPVNANQPYIVGERGPELMIPSSQGRIISNENLRSEMDRSAATRSAMARNPGAGVIDVRYSVERINNVDYVTASEFQQGMAQAAKQGAVQGEQRAMRTLKNSASTRRSVGF